MTSAASPIQITPRNSPPAGSQTSNLTTQLQNAGPQHHQAPHKSPFLEARRGSELRPESFGNMYGSSFHSRPIAMADRNRRGSNNVNGGSLMGGMSWGGLSVGSYIRDDVLMGDGSYQFQSPSFHSSSYLPKMEANFMRDYVCCGFTLDSLHELLQHYEEAHAGVPTQTMGRTPKDQQTFSSGRPADAATAAALMQQQLPQGSEQLFQNQNGQGGLSQLSGDPLQHHTDMDDMDMDMDDAPAPAVQAPHHQFQPQPQFGRQQQQPRTPTLDTQSASTFQGNQNSSPNTPQPNQSFGLHHNPTVSSVNTPTFGQTAGDSSIMKTPGELDIDTSTLNTPRAGQGEGFDFSGLNMGEEQSSGTIDEPAKRLLSKQGFGGLKTGLAASQVAQNSEIARKMREQQMAQGINPAGFAFGQEEIKPFKCPVIGCEKAYKNQNGLKYHKQHGHQNQQLKENPDGSFSIVDPATSIPYPGTVGMEKEKPYRCEVCGKRYKNLNGLKYHRQHSPPCNPDLKLNPSAGNGMSNNLQGLNVNVAGAGLVGDSLGF